MAGLKIDLLLFCLRSQSALCRKAGRALWSTFFGEIKPKFNNEWRKSRSGDVKKSVSYILSTKRTPNVLTFVCCRLKFSLAAKTEFSKKIFSRENRGNVALQSYIHFDRKIPPILCQRPEEMRNVYCCWTRPDMSNEFCHRNQRKCGMFSSWQTEGNLQDQALWAMNSKVESDEMWRYYLLRKKVIMVYTRK